jgi:hypothetical protein
MVKACSLAGEASFQVMFISPVIIQATKVNCECFQNLMDLGFDIQ